jgi:type VI protein secretion system component VasK
MNPVVQAALGAILRWILTSGATFLVAKGIWTEDESKLYVGAAVVALLTLLYSVWNQYVKTRLINTALAMPSGSTRREAERAVSAGVAPPADVPSNQAPFLVGEANPKRDK